MNWREDQACFAKAIAESAQPVPDFMGPDTTKRRFNVYRNNMTVSLVEALMAGYPVVTQLVGDEFMQGMARVFVAAHPPRSPVLLDYGEELAFFIEGFSPAASLPYLADVSRLERAWNRAYHAADAVPLGVECLAMLSEDELLSLRFEMLPSVQLLSSDYPVASIWQAHQGQETPAGIPMDAERVLVIRPHWQVEIIPLSPSTYEFFSQLKAGGSFAEAVEALGADPSFDPENALAALFEIGCVAALRTTSIQHDGEEMH